MGIVYQASNFIYIGLTIKMTDYREPTDTRHSRHGYKKKGDLNAIPIERSRKHRYVYFNCSKKKRKHLVQKLRYKILPYPKK